MQQSREKQSGEAHTESNQCRICLEEVQMSSSKTKPESDDLLSLPCECGKSLKLVHPGCLQKWIQFRHSSEGRQKVRQEIEETFECEICRKNIVVVKRVKGQKLRIKSLLRVGIDIVFMGVALLLIFKSEEPDLTRNDFDEPSFSDFIERCGKFMTGLIMGGLVLADLLNPMEDYLVPIYEIVDLTAQEKPSIMSPQQDNQRETSN